MGNLQTATTVGLRTDKNVVCAVVHNDHDIQQQMYDSLSIV